MTYIVDIQNISDWHDIVFPVWEKYTGNVNAKLAVQSKKIYPPCENVFEAFTKVHVADFKVCIIGMDPYINEGEAHGLAFSVYNDSKKCPPSLSNIFKELHREYPDVPKRTNKNLTDWAEQGVLLLNTALTVLEGESGSHMHIWRDFMQELFANIAGKNKNIVYILWGNHAHKYENMIDTKNNLVLKHSHPSPLSRKPFVGNGHFSECNDYLISIGKTPIEWV